MTDAPNTVRGEVSLSLGGKNYVLRPEHGRAVRLDDALPLGILGTLVQMTQGNVYKSRTMATVVHFLADGHPPVEDLVDEVMKSGTIRVSPTVVLVLSAIAAGKNDSGEGVAPSA